MPPHPARASRLTQRPRVARLAVTAALLATLGLTAACSGGLPGGGDQDSATPPKVGECRNLSAADLGDETSNPAPVDCSAEHTAETFFVGTVTQLGDNLDEADYDSRAVQAAAAHECSGRFTQYLGADESTAMRALISWTTFWPTAKAWGDGARWYRCDAVGGAPLPTTDGELTQLPETVKSLLVKEANRERWLACIGSGSVDTGRRIPCTKPHIWRAVTTIKVGEAADAYPGDAKVVERTEDFCASSVSAWLGYPEDFDFGYTWFGEGAWEGGNRRSVCWAKTNR